MLTDLIYAAGIVVLALATVWLARGCRHLQERK